MRLDGKVAIVTGSTKGIGRVIATTFAAEGARVVVAGRSRQRGEDVAAGIRNRGGDAIFVPTDVSDEAQVEALIARTVDTYGALTTLVNNAASTDLLQRGDDEVTNVDLASWEKVIRITLTGTMLMCRQAIPRMIASGGGSIVNISSDSSLRAANGFAAYGAAKSGVNSLTRSIAVECGHDNIRANTIIVGLILPPQAVGVFEADPALDAKLRAGRTLPRLGRREDVAGAAVYFASDDAEYVTGTMLSVDGGASVMTNVPGKTEIFEGKPQT
jgi:NAD(P)-dependent dehydrogenase (short-subunit alcohol dehydrogenase family)